MSKIHKFCAHLEYDDNSHKDLNVEILKRVSKHKFLIQIKIKANQLNKCVTICKNGKIELEIEAPKKCPSGCDCDSFSLNVEL